MLSKEIQTVLAVVKLYVTNTTIDLTEINRVLERGAKVLADLSIEQAYSTLYMIKDDKACLRRMLYLYLYAVESWVTCEDAHNYMTETQLIDLLAAVENLFMVCAAATVNVSN